MITTMTSLFRWNQTPNFNIIKNEERPMLATDFLVTAPNDPTATDLYVFIIIQDFIIYRSFWARNQDFTIPKLANDLYLKMALIQKSDFELILYSITKGKKITRFDCYDFEAIITQHTIKSFTSQSEEIKLAEYLERTTYFIACNNVETCAVINFLDKSADDRQIIVGKGYSRISLLSRARLFTASYPDTNSIAFYHLKEAACVRVIDKDCEPFDT
jgi:hypothetical protein